MINFAKWKLLLLILIVQCPFSIVHHPCNKGLLCEGDIALLSLIVQCPLSIVHHP